MSLNTGTAAQTLTPETQFLWGNKYASASTLTSPTQASTGKKANEAGTGASTLTSPTQAASGFRQIGSKLTGTEPMDPTASLALVTTADVNLALQFAAGYARFIYVGGAGNLVVQELGDTAPVTITAPPVGTLLPGKFTLVKSTGNGTTATALVAFA